jgi:hypothetical protein
VILLYFELTKNFCDIDNLHLTFLCSQYADQMLLITTTLYQRVRIPHVCFDDQLEVDRFESSQISLAVVVHKFHKAAVAHGDVFVGSDIDHADDTAFFSDHHDGVNRGEGDTDYLAPHNQDSLEAKLFEVPKVDGAVFATSGK